jgi:hypothetical protein
VGEAINKARVESILDAWCAGGLTLAAIGEQHGIHTDTTRRVIFEARRRGDVRARPGKPVAATRARNDALLHDWASGQFTRLALGPRYGIGAATVQKIMSQARLAGDLRAYGVELISVESEAIRLRAPSKPAMLAERLGVHAGRVRTFQNWTTNGCSPNRVTLAAVAFAERGGCSDG